MLVDALATNRMNTVHFSTAGRSRRSTSGRLLQRRTAKLGMIALPGSLCTRPSGKGTRRAVWMTAGSSDVAADFFRSSLLL